MLRYGSVPGVGTVADTRIAAITSRETESTTFVNTIQPAARSIIRPAEEREACLGKTRCPLPVIQAASAKMALKSIWKWAGSAAADLMLRGSKRSCQLGIEAWSVTSLPGSGARRRALSARRPATRARSGAPAIPSSPPAINAHHHLGRRHRTKSFGHVAEGLLKRQVSANGPRNLPAVLVAGPYCAAINGGGVRGNPRAGPASGKAGHDRVAFFLSFSVQGLTKGVRPPGPVHRLVVDLRAGQRVRLDRPQRSGKSHRWLRLLAGLEGAEAGRHARKRPKTLAWGYVAPPQDRCLAAGLTPARSLRRLWWQEPVEGP